MKIILKLEELGQIVLGYFLFIHLSFDWWWFLVWFLAPDIGMIGYIVSNKAGAFLYNCCHHKGLAIVLYLCGVYVANEYIQFVGIILFTHSAFDRLLGYGLKYEKGFKYTHLGNL